MFSKIHTKIIIRTFRKTAQKTAYRIMVYTGDKFGAGTDANVFIELYGENDSTGVKNLHILN